MRKFDRGRTAAAVILAAALVTGLTSCTGDTIPTTWDSAKGALVVGDAAPRLHLWLEFGSAGTATFLRDNESRLREWQDSEEVTISYHAVSIPGSSTAIQSYSRTAGATLAAVGLSKPDELMKAMRELSEVTVTSGPAPTAKQVQARLAKAGIKVDVASAVKKYGKSIDGATARNTAYGPVRAESTAAFNGNFVTTGSKFAFDVAHQLRKYTAANKK